MLYLGSSCAAGSNKNNNDGSTMLYPGEWWAGFASSCATDSNKNNNDGTEMPNMLSTSSTTLSRLVRHLPPSTKII